MTIDNKKIDKDSIKYREYMLKKAAIYKIVAFLCMLCIGAVISLIIPLRPTVSENEKRTLTTFPEFKGNDFMNGTYFSQIDTWFSDTFPFRDELITCSEKITSLYGVRKKVVHGEVTQGDDIPDVDIDMTQLNKKEETQEDQNDSTQSTTVNEVLEVVKAEDIGTYVEDTDGTTAAQAGEKLGSIFVLGDKAYNYYAFSQNSSDRYVSAINKFADEMKGKAVVYDMIAPTSIDITLDDATRNTLQSSNQKKAMLYMYSQMNSNVMKTYVYDTLKEHRNDYVFFRTDHHWTALGAFYAYEIFIEQAGKKAAQLSDYQEMQFDNFKGSFYTQSGENSLATNPDTVFAYIPKSTNSMQFINNDNLLTNYNIVTDVSNWSSTSKYSTFIGGDNSYTQITNPDIHDGSACLLIKESFGNCFAPFIVQNYENVYVVDYRYYNDSIKELIDGEGISTVLILNNIAATSTSQRVEELEALFAR